MRSTQTSLVKKIASFLTATSIMCSVCGSNFSAFADYFDNASRYKASIVDDTENGTVEFVANERYEDVYKEVPIENSEISITVNENGELVQEVISDSDLTEEITELVTEEPTEEVSTEASTEATEVTEETTVTETTEAVAEVAEETVATEVSTEDATIETTVEVTEEITEEIIEEAVEETTEEKIIYTTVVDPRAKNIFSGDTVILNAIPDEGYYVESIYVVADSGKAVAYSFNDNVISFNMPKTNVTIRATFTDDLSEIDINDSVVDSYTYIRSNLNSDYVTMNKWETINAILVKQTVVDKSVFTKNNIDITLDNFGSDKYNELMFSEALINFKELYAPVYDVDDNSNYYVAFVNTMQNDDCEVYDWSVAESNNYGIALEDNYFDKNTGILYINKNNMSNANTEDIVAEDLFDAQVQLLTALNSANNTDHTVNLIVNDSKEVLDIKSGSITLSQYDSGISIKLAENSVNAKATIRVNGIEYGEINLLEDTSTDCMKYSADSRVLTIASKSIDTNSIEVSIDEENNTKEPIEDALTAAAFTVSGSFDSNCPKWVLKSGSASTGVNPEITCGISIAESFNSNSSDSYFSSVSGAPILSYIIDGLPKNISGLTYGTKSWTYTYKVNTSGFGDFKVGSSTWSLKHQNNKNKALLVCAHNDDSITDGVDIDSDSDAYDGDKMPTSVRLRILSISGNTITWGMMTKYYNTQVSLGIFQSTYEDKRWASLEMTKNFNNPELTEGVTEDFYNYDNVEYTLYNSSDTAVAKLSSTNTEHPDVDYNGSSNDNVLLYCTILNSNYAEADGIYKIKVKPGTYYLRETKTPEGYAKRIGLTGSGDTSKATYSSKTIDYELEDDKFIFTLDSNEHLNLCYTDFKDNPFRRNYAVATSFKAAKIDKQNSNNSKDIRGGAFSLYYSADSNVWEDVGNYLSDYRNKISVNTISEGFLANKCGLKRIARFEVGEDGVLIPEVVTPLFSTDIDPTNNDAVVNFPATVQSLKYITHLPLGNYIFIEEKAPTNYVLDAVDSKPSFYHFDFTPEIKTVLETKGVICNLDFSDNVKTYKCTYNPSNDSYTHVTTSIYNTSSSSLNIGNTEEVGVAVQKEVPNYLEDGSTKLFTTDNFASVKANTTVDEEKLMHYFLTLFSHRYSVENAYYKIYVNDTVYAGGYTDAEGNVIWTSIGAVATDNGIHTDSDNKWLRGFPHGTKIKLVEITRSSGTYIRTKTSYHTLTKDLFIGANGTIEESANENGLQLNELTVDKIVNTTDGNKIRFSSATDDQKEKYFKGMSFELYYYTDLAAAPEVKQREYKDDDTYKMNDSWELADGANNYGHVATIAFIEENGKIVQDIQIHAFSTTAGSPIYYKADVEDIENSDLKKLTMLPLGNYLIFEATPADNNPTDINNATGGECRQGKMSFAFTAKGEDKAEKDIIMYNSSTEENANISLRKNFTKSLSEEELIKANGARYYIYRYCPPKNDDSYPEKLTESEIGIFSKGMYFGDKKIYLVGEFNTVYNSDGEVHGVCVNNFFNAKSVDADRVWYAPDGSELDYNNVLNTDSLDVRNLKNSLINSNAALKNVDYSKFNTTSIIKPLDLWGKSKDELKNISDDYTFECIPGQYFIVEAKAPFGYELDPTVHIVSTDSSDPTALTVFSEEKPLDDPLNVRITKVNKQGFEEYVSLEGTQFTLYYYEGVDSIEKATKPPVEFVYNTILFDSDGDGKEDTNEIDLRDPTYLFEFDKNKTKYEPYIDPNTGFIEFTPGCFRLVETLPVNNYNIIDQAYVVTVNGQKFNTVGPNFNINMQYGEDGKLNTYYLVYDPTTNTVKWLYVTSDSSQNVTFFVEVENDIGEPFEIIKKYATITEFMIPEKTRFKLIRHTPDNIVPAKTWEWEFDVYTNVKFDSEDSDVFWVEDADGNSDKGKPMIDGYKYEIMELDDNGHYKKQAEFTYELGMDITSLLDSSKEENTIYNYPQPSIRTIAWNSATSTKAAFYDGKVKLIDTVEISNIARDNTYIIQGIAMDVTDPNNIKPLTVNGQIVRGSAAVYAYDYGNKLTNAHVNVEYEFEGTKADLEGKTINFYEYLTLANKTTLLLDGQSPLFGDSVYDYNGYVNTNKLSIDGGLSFDTTSEGIDMKVFGSSDNIYDVKKNIWTKQLTPNDDATDAILKAINTGNNQELLNIPGVIYTLNKNDVIRHTEPEDENQNIYFPSIRTHESDVYTASHLSGLHYILFGGIFEIDNALFVKDSVTFKNVIPGEYILEVDVMDFDSQKSIANSIENITITSTDEITIDTSKLISIYCESEKFYITEHLYDSEYNLIATHTDRDVESQQGYIAKIGTTASNALMDSKLILDGSNATVKDTVAYRNLVEHNHEYYLYGFLVDTATNEIVSKASTSFNNGTNTNGTADVNFKFTAKPGQTLVAYEYLYWNNSGKTTYDSLNVGDTFTDDQDNKFYRDNGDYVLARHYDKTDVGQTVYVPKIGTEVLGDKEILPKSEVTITDQVFYENLLANETYTIYGYFVDKNKKVDESDDVLVATGRKTMTSTSTSGTATMDFTFDSTKFLDKEIVVYEYIYLGDVTTTFNPVVGQTFDKNAVPESLGGNGRMIGRHADSTDKKQTVHITIVYVDILKTDSDGNVLPGAKFRLTDLDNNKQLGEWITGAERKSFTLAPGDYMLEELEAPNGKALNTEIRFSVVVENSDIKVYYTGTNIELKSKVGTDGVKHYELDLADPDLTRLPTAGGTGVLPIVGAGLLCIAAGAFVIKRRKSNNNEEI